MIQFLFIMLLSGILFMFLFTTFMLVLAYFNWFPRPIWMQRWIDKKEKENVT